MGVSVSPTITDPYNSDVSTKDTIHRMVEITLHSATSPAIQSAIKSCLSSTMYTSDHSDMSLVRCFYWWVKSRVQFTEDEDIAKQHLVSMGYTDEVLNTAQGSMDLLISPEVLLSMPQPTGDCDDYSMLLASLLIGAGFKTSFVTIAADPTEPERFSHVYVKTFLPNEGRDITLDASHGSFPGWEAPKYFRKAEWNIN